MDGEKSTSTYRRDITCAEPADLRCQYDTNDSLIGSIFVFSFLWMPCEIISIQTVANTSMLVGTTKDISHGTVGASRSYPWVTNLDSGMHLPSTGRP